MATAAPAQPTPSTTDPVERSATLEIITPNGALTGPALSVVPSEPEVFQFGPGRINTISRLDPAARQSR